MRTSGHTFGVALLGLLFSSCSAASAYRAPLDGRARVVWKEDGPVALVPASTEACEAAVHEASRTRPPGEEDVGHRFVPIVFVDYYEPVGLSPAFASRSVPRTAGARVVNPGSRRPRGNNSWGSGKLDWELLAVAIVVMPFITVGLAVGDAVDTGSAAAATDFVNAYNDLSRTPGTACAMATSGGVP